MFTCILCACLARSDNGTVPLFQQADNVLYSPTGHLQPLLASPAMIKGANEAVRELALTQTLMGMANSSH